MKLIKLSEEHYIVVDDSEIKKGDYFLYQFGDCPEVCQHDGLGDPNQRKNCYNITHSTQPLEDVGLNTSMGWQLGFDKIEPLSIQEVKELIGKVDVEKKAEHSSEVQEATYTIQHKITYKHGYFDGYNQALEDNKEKLYTEIDVLMLLQKTARKYFQKGREYRGNMAIAGDPLHGVRSELRELVQPKTEWYVELVDGKLKLK
jgi:hypothetical protein